jgi:uncharacterized OsmC-like protein
MNAEQLRAIQAPLKNQYREKPESAMVTAHAEGTLVMDSIGCSVRVWKGVTEAGLHPAGGGNGEQACSADMLLEALVGCAGVTFASVATAMGVAIHSGTVKVEGKWDARGTLGVDRSVPIGLNDIKLTFEIESDAQPEKITKLVELTERYCVIAQTLRDAPSLTVECVTTAPVTGG